MTLHPTVTGTSVVAVKYNGGVLVACDTLGSYGSLARFKEIKRIFPANASTLVAGDGEISDLQFIEKVLDEDRAEDAWFADGTQSGPRDVLTRMARMFYNRRGRMDPLWNNLVVAGWDEVEQKPFLGTTDLIGTMYEENYVATGLGLHIALPILRAGWRPDITEQEARALVENAMRVLFYRDTTTINRIVFATATAGPKLHIAEPVALPVQWSFKTFVEPKSEQTGSW